MAYDKGTPDSPEDSKDNKGHVMTDLGSRNHNPTSVGFIFARQAECERRGGLDIAATSKVWATTMQLFGKDPTAKKMLAALAASKQQAYRGDEIGPVFTLIHHLRLMDVELPPSLPPSPA